MKVLILAGGYGTRISEESVIKPKPMVEIGNMPIVWHIMKTYSHYGYNEFIILLGYKGYMIKEYFANYFLHKNNLTIDMANNKVEYFDNTSEPWKITLLDTGQDTLTGGRILRAKDIIGNEPFLLTYGDGVSNVDIGKLVEFHKSHDGLATLTSVQPQGRFGALDLQDTGEIKSFKEKPKGDNAYINGGFFVCEPQVLNYCHDGDATIFEKGPLELLAQEEKLFGYRHDDFWMCMDTMYDKMQLNKLWESGSADWRVWE